MRRRPSGPWYTAYIEAITASSTWAVQMLLVAFSRRMCCSRVCRARRVAGRPAASTETPTRRPGRDRLQPLGRAMKPAWGPPKPMGTPKRWVEPTTTSAPSSPGGTSSTRRAGRLRRRRGPRRRGRARSSRREVGTSPEVPGTGPAPRSTSRGPGRRIGSPTITSMPSGSARVATTAMVWGWQSASTKKVRRPASRSSGGRGSWPRRRRCPRRASRRWPRRCR
jgi:hypothetical protein